MVAPEFDWIDVTVRLAIAAALGGAIGLEREYAGQDAGFRTHLLVVVGAALFGLVSVGGFDSFVTERSATNVSVDVTRIASYVAAGIGFIGGGAILKHGGHTAGVTTAASLWSGAAVGLASGLGFWEGALVTTAIVLLALEALEPLGGLAHRLGQRRRAELTIVLRDASHLDQVVTAIQSADSTIRHLRFGEGPDDESAITVEFWERPGNADEVVRRITAAAGVSSISSRFRH
jgi:putative Mg2+ transporter-C (MgtC) family protein